MATWFVHHTHAVVITCEGATHPDVITTMLASGLLVEDGFYLVTGVPMVVMLPGRGISEEQVSLRILEEIERQLS
jgi:hypothetical protein